MKTSIATTLSIAGVLAAGAAAFALNSAVLSDDSAASVSLASQTTLMSAAAAASPATTLPSGQVAAADTPINPEPTKVNSTVTTYKVATAGSVIVDTASGAVKVTDIVPASGWTAEPARTEAGGLVKVHFSNGSTRIEFTAQMTNGSVVVNATTDVLPTAGAPAATAPRPSQNTVAGAKPSIPQSLRGGDDDDDDEHHEDHEDHEDEDDD